MSNARLNFREQYEDYLIENIIYNELLVRGYNVDVGVVELFEDDKNGKTLRKQLEVDFILLRSSYYLSQSLYGKYGNKDYSDPNKKIYINNYNNSTWWDENHQGETKT